MTSTETTMAARPNCCAFNDRMPANAADTRYIEPIQLVLWNHSLGVSRFPRFRQTICISAVVLTTK